MNKKNIILIIVSILLIVLIGCEACIYFGYDLYFSDNGVFIRKRAYIATYENMSESELEQKAQAGDADAMAQLGALRIKGEYEGGYEEAYNLVKKSSDINCARGQNLLGIMYQKGIYVPKDDKKAFDLYEKAAAQKLPTAFYNIACCYFNGIGVPKDEKEELKYLEEAAVKGLPHAQFALGRFYYNGAKFIKKDTGRGVEWLTLAAEQGLPDAQYELSKLYYKGENVTPDYEKAKELCNKAAMQGYPEARKEMENKYNSQDN